MATNPARVTDLSDRSVRPLSSQEQLVGDSLLGDAWAIIVSRIPSVATRLDAVPPDVNFRALVIQVECSMALRVLSNPDGKLEEHGDDYGYRLDASVSTGALYLSDIELGLLANTDGQSDGAFTIKPHGWGPDRAYSFPDTWLA